jgi:MoaA/NifB/PqqE/SkfB family radical SAM enzyme
MITLQYDTNHWTEIAPVPKNTLQLFITNRCNLRCKGCFMEHKLGTGDMPLSTYVQHVDSYLSQGIKKVIILGGEPTLHYDLPIMIRINEMRGLDTTIYTNGINLGYLEERTKSLGIDLNKLEIRVGVYGATESEKPLVNVENINLPITVVYMLRKDNIKALMYTASLASAFYNCKAFYISSIRDIAQTHDFWKDTEETISPNEYAEIVQEFINNYQGTIPEIHISRRGILKGQVESTDVDKCRFGNIFPDGEKIICPLDISLKKTVPTLEFGTRQCDKHGCILQKIVLRRK